MKNCLSMLKIYYDIMFYLLQERITTLILRCENDGTQIIKLLLDCISLTNSKGLGENRNDIVDKSKEILCKLYIFSD